VKIYSFERNSGKPLTAWTDTKGVKHRVDPKASKTVIAPVFGSQAPAKFACFYIGPGGFIPRHPATGPQLFAIVEGSGWVSGTDGRKVQLGAGFAAYWEADEEHESGTEKGMTAVVVEGDSFDPGLYMREVRK
jgi:quercetin dioxygenase-like cupin family protein